MKTRDGLETFNWNSNSFILYSCQRWCVLSGDDDVAIIQCSLYPDEVRRKLAVTASHAFRAKQRRLNRRNLLRALLSFLFSCFTFFRFFWWFSFCSIFGTKIDSRARVTQPHGGNVWCLRDENVFGENGECRLLMELFTSIRGELFLVEINFMFRRFIRAIRLRPRGGTLFDTLTATVIASKLLNHDNGIDVEIFSNKSL